MRLLEEADVEIEGANAVVLGRSNIVGMPVALLLVKQMLLLLYAIPAQRIWPIWCAVQISWSRQLVSRSL